MGWEKQKGVGERWERGGSNEGMNSQFNLERNDSSWRFEDRTGSASEVTVGGTKKRAEIS